MIDPSSAKLIDMLHVTRGRLPIADIARLLGIDVRTVRRDSLCQRPPPKQLDMVVHFHRALRLRFHDRLDVALTAIEASYADQAYMSLVPRRMSGFSPARLPR